MSEHVNQQVAIVSNNLTDSQRNMMSSIQQGHPIIPNPQQLGQMIRSGLIQLGTTGGLALSNVGNRIINV